MDLLYYWISDYSNIYKLVIQVFKKFKVVYLSCLYVYKYYISYIYIFLYQNESNNIVKLFI